MSLKSLIVTNLSPHENAPLFEVNVLSRGIAQRYSYVSVNTVTTAGNTTVMQQQTNDTRVQFKDCNLFCG